MEKELEMTELNPNGFNSSLQLIRYGGWVKSANLEKIQLLKNK